MGEHPDQELSGSQSAAVYGVVFLSLVVVGAVLRTPVLNWLVGPAWVVVGVTVLHRLLRTASRSEP